MVCLGKLSRLHTTLVCLSVFNVMLSVASLACNNYNETWLNTLEQLLRKTKTSWFEALHSELL